MDGPNDHDPKQQSCQGIGYLYSPSFRDGSFSETPSLRSNFLLQSLFTAPLRCSDSPLRKALPRLVAGHAAAAGRSAALGLVVPQVPEFPLVAVLISPLETAAVARS